MMFETDYDEFNRFGDEAVGGRKAIYELIGVGPKFIAAPNIRPKEKSDVIRTF